MGIFFLKTILFLAGNKSQMPQYPISFTKNLTRSIRRKNILSEQETAPSHQKTIKLVKRTQH
jgi:hypothetical protein